MWQWTDAIPFEDGFIKRLVNTSNNKDVMVIFSETGDFFETPEDKLNAKLIEQAPELLIALKKLLKVHADIDILISPAEQSALDVVARINL
jgi:hypothetical protein